jgi:DNA-binding beta-propeller fold protein YncE
MRSNYSKGQKATGQTIRRFFPVGDALASDPLCSYWSFSTGPFWLRRRKQQQRLWHAAPGGLAVTQVGKYALMVKAASGNMNATLALTVQ